MTDKVIYREHQKSFWENIKEIFTGVCIYSEDFNEEYKQKKEAESYDELEKGVEKDKKVYEKRSEQKSKSKIPNSEGDTKTKIKEV